MVRWPKRFSNGTEIKNNGRPTLDVGMSISGMNENRMANPHETGSVWYSKTAAPPKYSAEEKAAWVADSIYYEMV
jgi:hypothetical protein